MSRTIPSQEEYEQREAAEFRRQIHEAERNPSRRHDCDHFREQLAADPELIAERIRWLIDGTYGYGAMQAAKAVLASPRINRVAWLVQTVGAIEWRCPRRAVVAAWKSLSSVEQRALDGAVHREIRRSDKGE